MKYENIVTFNCPKHGNFRGHFGSSNVAKTLDLNRLSSIMTCFQCKGKVTIVKEEVKTIAETVKGTG